MDLRILGYIAASHLLQSEPSQWDALVVLDSNSTPTDFVGLHSRRHIFLRFDDITVPESGRRLVSSEQIQQGLEFASSAARLLVTCRAGQSRSAAMAYLIACQHLGTEVAERILDPKRHVPNRLVVRLGSALVESPDVESTFARWRQRHAHIALSEYYDEIESEIDALEQGGAVNRIVAD